MAAVMMGGDDKNPTFHDFLGITCNDSLIPNESSDLGSERQGANNSEVFQFHGRKNSISGPEVSNTFSGRKRSSSSSYIGLVRDRMLPTCSDSLESSRLMKMFGKEVASERLGRPHDDETPFSMQPPPRPSSSLVIHSPVSTRVDSQGSKWERSLPINPGQLAHYPSRFGQSGVYVERHSSAYTYKDVNVGTTLLSQAAADEGSRTGMKGSGILKIINPSNSGSGERYTTGILPYGNRPKAPQIVEPESSSSPSRHNMAPATRQMTIFYAGQAHVFDDVHPNKADIIMALAGSNGGSWSTTYSPKSGVRSQLEPNASSRETEMRVNTPSVSIPGSSDHGLISQVARIPHTSDLSSLRPGGHQNDRAVRDGNLTSAAELDTDSKRDA